jgi:LmbE family N-acetylglucosaminyl deacetylase
MTITTNLEPPVSVLAVGAHPDDIDFSCGATLAKWAAVGAVVHELVFTDGSKGTWDPATDIRQLIALRESEQRTAHKTIGGTGEVVFLRCVDGELSDSPDLRREICRWIRVLAPEVVIGHDPWRHYNTHPDHRAAGFLTVDAAMAARDPLFFPEQLEPPHRVGTVLLWKAQEIDHLEDVREFAEAKVRAVLAHRSQYQTTLGVPSGQEPDLEVVREGVFSRLRLHDADRGFELAEGFKRLRL